ncbi:unnamed protein product [Dovyalis caffra]|uniref:Uncharacterized protein n=1 Tax=Dovyalis caffra TaxID=77055 RepID=A0AAV1RIQ7_9ROSI|nr:unnamed protein product [Dovyalis caffra]
MLVGAKKWVQELQRQAKIGPNFNRAKLVGGPRLCESTADSRLSERKSKKPASLLPILAPSVIDSLNGQILHQLAPNLLPNTNVYQTPRGTLTSNIDRPHT